MSARKGDDDQNLVFFALILGFLIYSSFSGYWMDFWVAEDSKQTTASIVTKKKHGVYGYQYQVAGNQYSGQGQGGINPDRDAHVGGEWLVYYSQSHPWFSSTRMPTFSPWRAAVIMGLQLYVEFRIVKALVVAVLARRKMKRSKLKMQK